MDELSGKENFPQNGGESLFPWKFYIVDLLIPNSANQVACIPNTWLYMYDGKHPSTYYPKKNGQVAAKKRKTPNIDWLTYYCVVRHGYNSYAEGTEKLPLACNQTDIDTGCEENSHKENLGKHQRQKTKNPKYIDDDDDSRSSIGYYGPTQHTTEKGATSALVCLSIPNIPDSLSKAPTAGALSKLAVDGRMDVVPYTVDSENGSQSQQEEPSLEESSGYCGSSLSSTQSSFSSMHQQRLEVTIKELAKEVFKSNSCLTEALKELRDLKDMVAKIQSTETSVVPHVIPVQDSELLPEPLKEIEDITPFEKLLKEDMDKYFKLVTIIRQLGGQCLSDALKRSWSTVFSLKVMANVNWQGKAKKGVKKFGLQHSIITKAVFAGVRSGKFSYKDHELEYETVKLMKSAPEKYRKAVSKQESLAAALADESFPPMEEPAANFE